MQRSLMLVTALAPQIGYSARRKSPRRRMPAGTTLREEAVRLGYVSAGGVRSPRAAGKDDAATLI